MMCINLVQKGVLGIIGKCFRVLIRTLDLTKKEEKFRYIRTKIRINSGNKPDGFLNVWRLGEVIAYKRL